jgi:glycerophosphoryl diester phosphodiesterase
MQERLPSRRDPPIGFAHRGARAHERENTLAAFRLALRLGATGLESDVWRTSDGKAVLDHDGIAGGRLKRRKIGEVAREDLPEHIPALAELYDECGTDFELSLDVMDEAVVPEVVATARDVGVEHRLWLCHADWELVASWRELSPHVRLVHSSRLSRLDGGPERHVARLAHAGVDALNLHHTEWSGGLAALVHRFELEAFAWDAQFERVLEEVVLMGVDGVYSDHVDVMSEVIGRLAGNPPPG